MKSMFSRFLLFLFVSSEVLAIPTAISFGEFIDDSRLPASLPNDIMNRIKDFTDNNTSFALGMTSKVLNTETEERNKKNRLLLIRKHCGYRMYAQLTSNGYQIFSKSIKDSLFEMNSDHRIAGLIKKQTLCLHALISNSRYLGEKIKDLSIVLPTIYAESSLELESATNAFLSALDILFQKNSIFQKVSVYCLDVLTDDKLFSYNFQEAFLPQKVETKLLNQLSRLTIDYIGIHFKIRNLRLFSNPSIKKLSAGQEFFVLNRRSELPGLNSIIYPRVEAFNIDLHRIANAIEVLRIARAKGVKELTIPLPLVPEALSNHYDIERLNILGSLGINSGSHYLNMLLFSKKALTGLKFGKYLFPPYEVMSIIIEKYKPSLTYFSLFYQGDRHVKWEGLLRTLLLNNSRLNELHVSLDHDSEFNHSYLEDALNITSYSFEGKTVSGAHVRPLLTFIASHKRLRSISMKFDGVEQISVGSFFAFFENLVTALHVNPSIERVDLGMNIEISNFDVFTTLFAEKLKPLLRRGLVLNQVSVDKIVSDVGDGLEEGVLWTSNASKIFSLE